MEDDQMIEAVLAEMVEDGLLARHDDGEEARYELTEIGIAVAESKFGRPALEGLQLSESALRALVMEDDDALD